MWQTYFHLLIAEKISDCHGYEINGDIDIVRGFTKHTIDSVKEDYGGNHTDDGRFQFDTDYPGMAMMERNHKVLYEGDNHKGEEYKL